MSQQWPSNCARLLAYLVATTLFATHLANASSQIDVDADLKHMLGRCHRVDEDFNECMRQVFNDLRAYFTTGVPDYNIKPFDPHHCGYVELRRGASQGLGSFRLILRNVSEYGWARSEVTKFHADPEDHRIVYTQYFPDKSLEGEYEFAAKMLGTEMNRRGHWNLTLYDYRDPFKNQMNHAT
ncbi:uncharacterized protein Dyak_GE28935 [Drosophila yakuba]|uniref:Uncharacterized protein n=1 Tax=Drosophila yakuba TaxID=7245 RepID=A0A0R1E199_DROYA|nr:uncharacterized protein Dyak_GE28935 [Drosophila yakuba]